MTMVGNASAAQSEQQEAQGKSGSRVKPVWQKPTPIGPGRENREMPEPQVARGGADGNSCTPATKQAHTSHVRSTGRSEGEPGNVHEDSET